MLNLIKVDGFHYEKFETYEELINMFFNSEIHDRVTTHDLGVSSDGINHVYGFSVGDIENKPMIYMQHQIHGRHEWRCSHWGFKFLEKLVTGEIKSSHLVNKLLANFSLFVIPCLNPYGYENGTYGNANGVNLNRNFDYNWHDFEETGSYFGTTKGEYPFSEPETQMIKRIVDTYKPLMYIDTHTRGGNTVGSMYPGAVERTDYYLPFFREVATSFRITADVNNIGFLPPTTRPEAHAWGSMQTSKAGMPTISTTIEAPELVSEYEQSVQGMNLMWVCCNYAMRHYENRLLRQQ